MFEFDFQELILKQYEIYEYNNHLVKQYLIYIEN